MTDGPDVGGGARSDPGNPSEASSERGLPDPWRSFRGVMAGTLVLEAIVVLLALPVVAVVGGGLTPGNAIYLLGLAVVLIGLAALQRLPLGDLGQPGDATGGDCWGDRAPGDRVHRRDLRRRLAVDSLSARASASPPAAWAVAGSAAPARLESVDVTEQTLVLIKPDAVARKLVGEIVGRIERKGLTLVALELRNVTDELARRHYAEHDGKPFFGSLLEFITSGPVVAAIVEGPRAVAAFRQIAGATDPVEKAAPGSIRGDLALSVQDNLVHGSDSLQSAEREIALWFPGR